MDEKEINEMLQLLHQAGMRAELCDTPVRLAGATAHCGDPAEIGDDDMSEYILLPKTLIGMYPEMFVPVEGDSMRDAGYEPGDRLRVRFGVTAHDGDNVLAMIDGRCTVKSLLTDEDDLRWLVPQNENYDAIELTEGMDVRIMGVVVGVEKASTRASTRLLLRNVRRTKNNKKAAKKLTEEMVDAHIITISSIVVHARQWYAVFRAMVDKELIEEGSYVGFCERVRRLEPEHQHLPDSKELSRMAVQSFAKPVALWTEDNAPVRGNRYRDYLNIALQMGALLAGEKD